MRLWLWVHKRYKQDKPIPFHAIWRLRPVKEREAWIRFLERKGWQLVNGTYHSPKTPIGRSPYRQQEPHIV